MVDKEAIRNRALHLVQADGRRVSRHLVQEFGISRQAVNNHLQELVSSGLVEAAGNTQGRVYRLVYTHHETKTYARDGLQDYVPWRELFVPVVNALPKNVQDIWEYGITEMVNNAVEHSEGSSVRVTVKGNALSTEGYVSDDGVGIFRKIQRELGLYDPREAFLELAKGKVTTDPTRHTGEGIFFTSRVFDAFGIVSDELVFAHNEGTFDVLAERLDPRKGTIVALQLENDSRKSTQSVFDKYSGGDDYAFSRTIVPIKQAQREGQKLVSRSQARRLTAGLNRFSHVILDFSGVVEIGQAFADEVFRVFARANPEIEIVAAKAVRRVKQMIDRARAVPGAGEADRDIADQD